MKTIPSHYAAAWIEAMFLADAVLTKARLGQTIAWNEAFAVQFRLQTARQELMNFAVSVVAVEEKEVA